VLATAAMGTLGGWWVALPSLPCAMPRAVGISVTAADPWAAWPVAIDLVDFDAEPAPPPAELTWAGVQRWREWVIENDEPMWAHTIEVSEFAERILTIPRQHRARELGRLMTAAEPDESFYSEPFDLRFG